MKLTFRALLLLWLCLNSTLLSAQPSARFTINATIRPGCLINSNGMSTAHFAGEWGVLNFETDAALSQARHTAHLTENPQVILSCTSGTQLTMSIDGGQHYNGGWHMQQDGGSALLGYQLYGDASLRQPLTANQPIALDTQAAPQHIMLPVHAQLILPGNLPAGRYTDTLTVTLQW